MSGMDMSLVPPADAVTREERWEATKDEIATFDAAEWDAAVERWERLFTSRHDGD